MDRRMVTEKHRLALLLHTHHLAGLVDRKIVAEKHRLALFTEKEKLSIVHRIVVAVYYNVDVSLVPRLSPCANKTSILQVTESWAGPGKEATTM